MAIQKRLSIDVWLSLECEKRLMQVELDKNLKMDEFLMELLKRYKELKEESTKDCEIFTKKMQVKIWVQTNNKTELLEFLNSDSNLEIKEWFKVRYSEHSLIEKIS